MQGSTFLWKWEHPGNTHSERRTMNCLNLGRGRQRERQAISLRLYTAANGRCLIKAFAISLACSVILFCKQIRWENIFAFGNLVLKNFSCDHAFVLFRKELNRYAHIVKYLPYLLVQNSILPSISSGSEITHLLLKHAYLF